jgi:hypothetical protein
MPLHEERANGVAIEMKAIRINPPRATQPLDDRPCSPIRAPKIRP